MALPQILLDALHLLDVADDKVLHADSGVGFVAADLGTWLAMDEDGGVRVETRLATGVQPASGVLRYLDEMNGHTGVERFVFDTDSQMVAVTGAVPVTAATPEIVAFTVASVTAAAERAAFADRPRRALGAEKARTVVPGYQTPSRPHPIVDWVANVVVPGGEHSEASSTVLTLVQDVLFYVLPGWATRHSNDQTAAAHDDGTVAVLGVRRHPALGWGLQVAARPPEPAWDSGEALGVAARRTAHLVARSSLGTWATGRGGHLECRAFLPEALCTHLATHLPTSRYVEAVIADVTEAARHGGVDAAQGPLLVRPVWPGDHAGATLARRAPTNEGSDAVDAFVWLDHLGRAAYTGPTAFADWYGNLRPEDHTDSRVAGYAAWWRRERAARDNRDQTVNDSRGNGEH